MWCTSRRALHTRGDGLHVRPEEDGLLELEDFPLVFLDDLERLINHCAIVDPVQ